MEWNDAYRDDVRSFWRGDAGQLGALATRLCGSDDVFGRYGETHSRSIGFIAAHDGFSLADLVSYEHKHNHANGEENRDGHNENLSWNNGEEGQTDVPEIVSKRLADLKALLGTLFMSRGPIMLTAGDEFGRSQNGNNNAYAQDNEISWLNWEHADNDLIEVVAELAKIRDRHPDIFSSEFLIPGDVEWHHFDGRSMTIADWETPAGDAFALVYPTKNIAILFNRSDKDKVYLNDIAETKVPGRSVKFVQFSESQPK
jgi:glycogen operon protein